MRNSEISSFMIKISREYTEFSLIAILFIAILLVTQTYADKESFQENGFTDTKSYLALANCPHIADCKKLGEMFPAHHIQRWLPNILVGISSRALDVELENAYLGFQFFLIFCVYLLTDRLVISNVKKLMLFTFVIYFPYGFRSYLYAPPMFADALFFTMCYMFAVGVLNKNNYLIITSLVISSFCRQTAILLIPIVGSLAYFGRLERNMALPISILITSLFFLNITLARSFFGADSNTLFQILVGIFFVSSTESWVGFLARLGLFLFLLSPCLALKVDKCAYTLFLIIVIIVSSQPFLAGPEITGGNIARLMAYSVAFVPFLLIDMESPKVRSAVIFLISVLMMSFHHHYSIVASTSSYLGCLTLGGALVGVMVFQRLGEKAKSDVN
jgi:hypothetical protein